MSWRDLEPTEEQLRVLRRWHRASGAASWRFVAPKTRGEASDIISSVVEAAKRRSEADAFDPPNEIDEPYRDWGDL